MLDYIYDKEGRGFEDESSHPPTDQPTKFGIDMATFKLSAKSILGIDPTLENLQKLTQDQADAFYVKYYFQRFNLDKINNLPVLKALFSQEPLGEYRMVVNAKKALNDITQSNYSTNAQAFSDAEVSALNSVDATPYIYSFATYQYQSYESIYDGNPAKYGAYIDGWINRLNELLDDKQKNFTSPKQKKSGK
ncbi:MAG: glycosyl hydrolase 108 family protein [Arachidicoccus sp.]|nr:glycosyl hydrolase 108 family protein [Arachidicoccus sp.]